MSIDDADIVSPNCHSDHCTSTERSSVGEVRSTSETRGDSCSDIAEIGSKSDPCLGPATSSPSFSFPTSSTSMELFRVTVVEGETGREILLGM